MSKLPETFAAEMRYADSSNWYSVKEYGNAHDALREVAEVKAAEARTGKEWRVVRMVRTVIESEDGV